MSSVLQIVISHKMSFFQFLLDLLSSESFISFQYYFIKLFAIFHVTENMDRDPSHKKSS